MPIQPNEPTQFQLKRLAHAQAITLEQLEVAKGIVATNLQGASEEDQRTLAVGVLQALASNYAAEIAAYQPAR